MVTCRWQDGRLGSIRADRPIGSFGAVVFHPNNDVQALPSIQSGYAPLPREIVQFMTTGKAPVANAETLEIFEFLDAAQRSKEKGGAPLPSRSRDWCLRCRTRRTPRHGLTPVVNDRAADNGHQRLDHADLVFGTRQEVPVDDDCVGQFARFQRSTRLLGEL